MNTPSAFASPLRFLIAAVVIGATGYSMVLPAAAQTPAVRKNNSARAEIHAAEALLVATEMRARTQRVARLYLELGAKTRLEKTGFALSRELSAIEGLATRMRALPAIQGDRAAERVLGKWMEMRDPLLAPYSRTNGDLVYGVSEELYNHTQKLAQTLESQITSDSAFAVDLSTRVMAQTERISKALIQSSLTANRGATNDIESWKREHATGMSQLAALKINDDYSRGNLALGNTLSKVFGDYVVAAMRNQKPEAVADVAKASDGLWDILASTRDRYEVAFRTNHGLPVIVRG
jgi:hypothetical protein